MLIEIFIRENEDYQLNNMSMGGIKKTGCMSLKNNWVNDKRDKNIREELKNLDRLIKKLPLPIPEKYLSIYGGRVKYIEDYLEQKGFLSKGDGIKITEK